MATQSYNKCCSAARVSHLRLFGEIQEGHGFVHTPPLMLPEFLQIKAF